MSVPLLPSRLPQKLLVMVSFLTLFGLLAALNDGGYIAIPSGAVFSNLFNLNKENTVPAWFSSGLLLLVAYCGFLVSQLESAHVSRFRRLWQLFALLFVLLSLDEAAALHERLQSIMERHGAGSSSFKFVWVIPALGVCAVLAVAYLRFVIALPTQLRWRLILAGVIYIGGAVGMEVIGGAVYSHFGNGLFYLLMTVLEEVLEMTGATFCLYTLCLMLELDAPGVIAKETARARLPSSSAATAS
jgi:hypothetical protein